MNPTLFLKLSFPVYGQIWLNYIMDARQFSCITKTAWGSALCNEPIKLHGVQSFTLAPGNPCR